MDPLGLVGAILGAIALVLVLVLFGGMYMAYKKFGALLSIGPQIEAITDDVTNALKAIDGVKEMVEGVKTEIEEKVQGVLDQVEEIKEKVEKVAGMAGGGGLKGKLGM